MKKTITAIFLFALSFVGCTTDTDDTTIEGVWVLTEWNVANGFDINNDGIVNTNILKELECVSNETLVFESTGVVTSNNTFNPNIVVSLETGSTPNYLFQVTCDDEGVISYATSFSVKNNVVLINEEPVIREGNKLTRLFVDAIKIYNEDFSEIIATKDLTLVYTN